VKQWTTYGKIKTNLHKILGKTPIERFIAHLVDKVVDTAV